MSKDDSSTYRDAGVDLDAGYEAVRRYKSAVTKTRIPGVLSEVGGFGGLFALRDAGVSLTDPVLVSATDGVGTKLKLAFALDRHDTIGVDCVAMCVNDVITTGARPLFFLDYLATGKLQPEQAAQIVEGIAAACVESGCALIGGETAEMPGFYPKGEYDVAGFCVGVVERSAIVDRAAVAPGDVLIGLASSGFHSNGYSLVRKILSDHDLGLAERPAELGGTIGDLLLEPTRLYPAAFDALADSGVMMQSAANITGGGFYENLPRALPPTCGAEIDPRTWSVPPIIEFIANAGNVSARERFSVFNMGIGMVVTVRPEQADAAIAALDEAGFTSSQIGRVTEQAGVHILGIDD